MTIQIGDRLPAAQFQVMTEDGPLTHEVEAFFAKRKVVMFALPGAFTPTCSARHLPGFIEQQSAFKAKGGDDIVCRAVNDVFVMDAWGKAQQADGIVMAADGVADFTKAMGLELDLHHVKFGLRSRRYAMLVDDGVVSGLWIEEAGEFKVSSAESVLANL